MWSFIVCSTLWNYELITSKLLVITPPPPPSTEKVNTAISIFGNVVNLPVCSSIAKIIGLWPTNLQGSSAAIHTPRVVLRYAIIIFFQYSDFILFLIGCAQLRVVLYAPAIISV